jgi:hypothetical protein
MSKPYRPPSYFLRRLTSRRDWYTPCELNRLLQLMTDANPRNRDWATFYVALSVHNSTAITRELVKNAIDTHRGTSAEAILGLARRHHRSACNLVKSRLSSKEIGVLDVKAAGYVANRTLIRPLKRIEKWWDVDRDYLTAAIRACGNGGRDDYNFD